MYEFANLIVYLLTWIRHSSSNTVTLYVGPKRKRYRAHYGLLYVLVPYFKNLADQNCGTLEHDSLYTEKPAAVDMFIVWLYRGPEALPESGEDISSYVDLYIMASQWGIRCLQNTVLDKLSAWFTATRQDVQEPCIQALTKLGSLNKPPLEELGLLMQFFRNHFIRVIIQQTIPMKDSTELLGGLSSTTLGAKLVISIALYAMAIIGQLDQLATNRALDVDTKCFYV